MGAWARLFGELSRGGLVLSAAGGGAGHRLRRCWCTGRAEHALAICLAGLTSLLASPISWSHHYVWIVPLAVVLLQDRHLARGLRVFGLLYVIWVVAAPFKQLPGGDGVEADLQRRPAGRGQPRRRRGAAFVVLVRPAPARRGRAGRGLPGTACYAERRST